MRAHPLTRPGGGRRVAATPPTNAVDRVPALDRADAGTVVVIVLGWLLAAWLVTRGERVFAFDTFRDMAYAENILHGRLWHDPTLSGLPWWYAPGNPMFFAAAAAATGRMVADLYGTSSFWLNWLNPVLLYLLVRTTWGRMAALVAVPMVGLGSYWWLTHALMPMPSVQGVALNLAGLLAWRRCARSRWRWPLVAGLLAALSLWHHPLCGALLLGAVLGDAIIVAALPSVDAAARPDRFLLLRRAALAWTTALALAGPLLLHLSRLPRLNLAPYRWFAPELHDPRFALHLQAPLVVPLGLLGLWLAVRRQPRAAWLVGYFAVGLVLQVAGYAAHDWGWPIPYLIPHEFQWHEQLALCVAAAVAVAWLAASPLPRLLHAPSRALTGAVLALALTGVAVGPAVTRLEDAGAFLLRLHSGPTGMLALAAWVRSHTPFDAVFVCDRTRGYLLAGLTGRKCAALPDGHMNPAADIATRYADVRTMLTTADRDSFTTLAASYGATYLLATPGPGASATTQAAYAHWRCLEPANLGDSTGLVYRIRLPATPAEDRSTR